MMRRVSSCVMMVVFFALLAGCTGSPYSRGTGEYVGDKAIATEVKSKLAMDKEVKAHQIEVEVYRGTVQLSGFVNDEAAKQRAAEIANQVDGVQKVVNSVVVKEPRQ